MTFSLDADAVDFIDIHYHANPDLYKRRYCTIEAAQHYQRLNGACVLKSHLGETSIQASIALEQGLPVLPSVALNTIAGGINSKVIMRALAQMTTQATKLIVDLPTITGRQHQSKLARSLSSKNLSHVTLMPTAIWVYEDLSGFCILAPN